MLEYIPINILVILQIVNVNSGVAILREWASKSGKIALACRSNNVLCCNQLTHD